MDQFDTGEQLNLFPSTSTSSGGLMAQAYSAPAEDSAATASYLKQIGSPLGVSGLNYQDRFVSEEFMPILRYPQAAKVFQEMSDNDATISAVLYMIEQLVMRASWTVVPASNDPIDLEKAQFLEECMNDMEDTWNDFIQEVLSMFIYGFSFHEIVYKYRRGPATANPRTQSKYSDNRIGWRKMPIRAQSSLYGWNFDEEGDAVDFIQQSPPEYKTVEIPLKRGLLFRTKHAKNNPEGRSLLRGAYRSWYFKKRMEEIEGIGVERDLAGLPILTPAEGVDIWSDTPEAAAKLAKATNVVNRVRKDRANGIVIPSGWDLKLLSAGSSKQLNTTEIINRYDQRISITLLSDIVMLGADKVGSFALADVKKSLLSASIEAQMGRIADVINGDAVPKLFAYNTFPETAALPTIVPGEVETPSVRDLADALSAVQLDIFASYKLFKTFIQMLSLPEIDEAEFMQMRKDRDAREAVKEVKSNGLSGENSARAGSNKGTQDTSKDGESTSNNEGE